MFPQDLKLNTQLLEGELSEPYEEKKGRKEEALVNENVS